MSIYDKASLVLIPSGTKTSKVFSQKPVNGDGDFTFSRSTAATRVNADGNIEKETQNLLLQSNSFDTTWGNSNTTETGGQTGYDGSNDAWLLTSTAGGGAIGQSISSSGVQTFSVYAKSGTLNWMAFTISGLSPSQAYFDLQNGALGSSGSEIITSNIESVGGGWYRCSVLVNGAASGVNIYPANANNQVSVLGSINIQDAQLEQGLVARDYIETTTAAVEGGITDNVPRLDYTDSSCPALLLEPQRTNQNNHSEYFGGWTANATITANAGISPEGVQNAYNIASNSGVGNGILKIMGVLSSTQYVCSLYVKSAGATTGKLRLFDGSTGASTTTTFTPTSEWQRVEVTRTSGSSTFQFRVDIHSNDGDLLIYGAQLEAGSYATSYIPTYGTSVTRNADSYYNNNMASLYDSANGFCLYFEYADVKRGGTAFFDYFSFQQLPNTDTGFRAEAAGANNLEWRVYVDNIDTDLGFPMRVSNIESKRKVLLKVETTGIKLFADGSIEDSQSGYVVIPTLGTLQPLRSTAQPAITQIKQSLGQILYLPVLSDAECLALTTI